MKFLPSLPVLSADTQAIREFLSCLPSVRGDLSTISAPVPLLAPKSVVEYPSTIVLHHSLFISPTTQQSPVDRAVSVFKNYICSLAAQINEGHIENGESGSGAVKKPLNPFLGELFVAKVNGGSDGETNVVCEQVSHHPPVTASYVVNKTRGIVSQGYLSQYTTFSPSAVSITIAQHGHAITHLEKFDEWHLTTYPSLRIRGLITGNRYSEFVGDCHIISSSGLITKIAFEEEKLGRLSWGGGLNGKGLKRRVEATISRWDQVRNTVEEVPLVKISGSWNGSLTITNTETGKEEVFDTTSVSKSKIETPPVEKQDSWESEKAWGGVKAALRKGDWKSAGDQKREIEFWQRGLRHSEELEGKKWIPRFFGIVNKCEKLENLGKATGADQMYDKTGVWRFVSGDDPIRRPFRQEVAKY